jgi:hypothetical protein
MEQILPGGAWYHREGRGGGKKAWEHEYSANYGYK